MGSQPDVHVVWGILIAIVVLLCQCTSQVSAGDIPQSNDGGKIQFTLRLMKFRIPENSFTMRSSYVAICMLQVQSFVTATKLLVILIARLRYRCNLVTVCNTLQLHLIMRRMGREDQHAGATWNRHGHSAREVCVSPPCSSTPTTWLPTPAWANSMPNTLPNVSLPTSLTTATRLRWSFLSTNLNRAFSTVMRIGPRLRIEPRTKNIHSFCTLTTTETSFANKKTFFEMLRIE